MTREIVTIGGEACFKLEDGSFILANAKENFIEGNNPVIADKKAYKRFVSGGSRASKEKDDMEDVLVKFENSFKPHFDSDKRAVEIQNAGSKLQMKFYENSAFGSNETLAWIELAITQHSKPHELDPEKFYANDANNSSYKHTISYDTVGKKYNPASNVSKFMYEKILQEMELINDGFYIVEVRASGIKLVWNDKSLTLKITKKTQPLF